MSSATSAVAKIYQIRRFRSICETLAAAAFRSRIDDSTLPDITVDFLLPLSPSNVTVLPNIRSGGILESNVTKLDFPRDLIQCDPGFITWVSKIANTETAELLVLLVSGPNKLDWDIAMAATVPDP
ncbi:hypothetical protein LXL04_023352 [Taraxacum kok-saghyz]